MRVKAVLGIDPGTKGCASRLTEDRQLLTLPFLNKSRLQIGNWLWYCGQEFAIDTLIEKVGARNGDTPITAWGLCRHNEIVLTSLECWRMPYEFIESKAWQYEFNLGGKQGPIGCSQKEEYKARKKAHQNKAQEIFFEMRVTEDRADSLLICEYNWRRLFGRLQHVETTHDGSARGTGLIGVSAPRVR